MGSVEADAAAPGVVEWAAAAAAAVGFGIGIGVSGYVFDVQEGGLNWAWFELKFRL